MRSSSFDEPFVVCLFVCFKLIFPNRVATYNTGWLLTLVEVLILAELVERLFAELEELDLFGEDVNRHVDRSPQSAVRLIVVEYGVEAGPISIKKVFVPERIEIAQASL